MTVFRLPQLDAASNIANYISNLFSQSGPGTQVFLAQAARYELYSPIILSHNDQEIATDGYPEDDCLKATLATVGEHADAIIGNLGLSRLRISNLIVDGMEPMLGRSEKSEPLLFLGGEGSFDCVVENCVLKHTRGWTCCHIFDSARGTKVLNNKVGPSGHPAPLGPWADGISAACRDGLIAGNTVEDATDGGIVLFCAPGTIVTSNTIIAKSRDLLGGINLVDTAAFDRDYTNTRVIGNKFISDGAFIKLAVGIGPLCWGDWKTVGAFGGFVENNHLVRGSFGYGFAAAGCKDFTVKGNYVSKDVTFEGDVGISDWNPAPAPFIRVNNPEYVSGTFQAEFTEGFIRFLIGIQPGLSSRLRYFSNGLHLDSQTNSCLKLKNGLLRLLPQGILSFEDLDGNPRWQSASPRTSSKQSRATFDKNGQLVIVDSETNQVLWNPLEGFPAHLQVEAPFSELNGCCMVVQDHEPFVCISDRYDNLLYSTNYVFGVNWSLLAGCFVAISAAPSSQPERGSPPPVLQQYRPIGSNQCAKPAFTWLFLDPHSGSLILHTSRLPNQIEESAEVWRSPNWKVFSDPSKVHEVKAVLQGDGNLVIYGDDGAIWATGTGGIASIAVRGAHEKGGARVDLLSDSGAVQWSTKQ